MSVIKLPLPKLDISAVPVSTIAHIVKPYYELFDLSMSVIPFNTQLVFTYTKEKILKGINLILFDQSGNMIYSMQSNNLNSLLYNYINTGSINKIMSDISGSNWKKPQSKPVKYLTNPIVKTPEDKHYHNYYHWPYYDSDSDDDSIDSWHDYMMHRNNYYYSHRY